MILKDYLLEELAQYSTSVEIKYGVSIIGIDKDTDAYVINSADGTSYKSDFVLNATYAGTNQILNLVDLKIWNKV